MSAACPRFPTSPLLSQSEGRSRGSAASKAHTFARMHTEALKHISQKCMHAPGIWFQEWSKRQTLQKHKRRMLPK